ncbi:MAG TPA: 2-dehydropantoate 2-reductase [Bacteroidia bacterium]|nr:2-dehydropantoate 2-reductase [Bacteroidia bacterium]
MNPLNNILIVGGGPIGLLLSNYFSKSNSNIFLLDTDKVKVNLIKSEGIIIENGDKKEKIILKNVYSSISEIDSSATIDIVIFSTKSYHTFNAAKQIKEKFGVLPVVSAQNGIETENILASVFGESNVLRLVINFAGNLLAPNVVKQSFFIPPNYIASIDDSKTHIASQFAQKLTSVQITTKEIDSFQLIKQVWEKTILNSALSALCGITKMTMSEVMNNPDLVDIVEQTIYEAVEVAQAEKIIFDNDFIRKCIRYLKNAGNHFPSLAIDMINGRETEIDYFNGKIIQYGRKHYIKTPINQLFYTIVKASSLKNLSKISSSEKILKVQENGVPVSKHLPHYLGVDLGSSYTKLVVIDQNNRVIYKNTLKTFNKDKISIQHVLNAIHTEFNIVASCATGYGRKFFPQSNITKTEINCAAKAANLYLKGEKCIIDIGGEDIKVIKCDNQGNVENFYLNDKCAAGTGSFIAEIAERVGIDIIELNNLAKHSKYNKPLNSFCTVFAKTEIMNWIFEGVPIQDIAKGIYLSIASRVSKLRIDTGTPVILVGGLAAYHPYLKEILEQTLNTKILVTEHPQHIVAIGAAIMAKEHSQYETNLKNQTV